MRLLTPFELSQLKNNEWINGRWYYDPYEIMKAQLDLDKQEIEIIRYKAFSDGYNMGARDADTDNKESIKEIFEKIEKNLDIAKCPECGSEYANVMFIPKKFLQALKEKYLK